MFPVDGQRVVENIPAATDSRTPAESRGLVSGRYLPTLDGWRAVAIVAVMAAHALRGPWAEKGARGVNIFFGISGFLICSRLVEERSRNGRISLPAFYIRRTFRIFPPYFAYLVALGVLTATGILAVTGREFLSCVFFVRNYLPTPGHVSGDVMGWYTGHFWSLAVEEHFYLIWPSLLIALGVSRARWAVVPLALGIGLWRVLEFRLRLLDRVLPDVSFYTRTDVSLDGLFWGCWLALMLAEPQWRERFERWLSPGVWLAVLAAYVALVVWEPLLHMSLEGMLIPLLLAGTILHPKTLVGKSLEWAPVRWIGRLSYSIYLWQQLFLLKEPENRAPALRGLQGLPVSLLAVLACAGASFYLIERPMIILGHRLSSRLSKTTRDPHATPAPAMKADPV